MTARVFVLVGVLALAGCNGGTVDRHALTNDAATLDSIACEGALLAHQAVKGASTIDFTREQAEELRIQAANLADALSKRPTATGLRERVRAKAADAVRLARQLHRLQSAPGDLGVARVVEASLKRQGKCT
jgi:hypothetical protein